MKRQKNAARCLALLLCACLLAGALPAHAALPEGATVWGYSEGLALCEAGGKWGYVNRQKQVVIPLKYKSAVSFALGFAAVNLDGRLGVIRQDGTYLIQPEYDSLLPLECGLWIAQKGGSWGVVSVEPFPDGKGGTTNVLYELTYDSAQVAEQGGVQVLALTKGGEKTTVPLFDLPELLLEKKAPSAHFPLSRGKIPTFSDVAAQDWYALWVDIAYNVGIATGVGNDQFGPDRTLTVAEALKVAAYMESRYKEDDFHLRPVTGNVWYRPAVDYCVASGIIKAREFYDGDLAKAITRAEMARIFGATTPAKEMPVMNDLARVKAKVPDVNAQTPAAEAIYNMYAKGILTGVDGKLTFRPNDTLTRAEMAAIVSRIARAEQRVTLFA